MASTLRMLAAGMSLAGNTVALIVFALGGGAVFSQILPWYNHANDGIHRVIDPSIIGWVFPTFFGMLLLLEVVLIYATYQTIFAKKTYYSEQGY